MHWTKVFKILNKLPSGFSYVFSPDEIREAAKCMLDSGNDYVRDKDVENYVNSLAASFNLNVSQNESGFWSFKK